MSRQTDKTQCCILKSSPSVGPVHIISRLFARKVILLRMGRAFSVNGVRGEYVVEYCMNKLHFICIM